MRGGDFMCSSVGIPAENSVRMSAIDMQVMSRKDPHQALPESAIVTASLSGGPARGGGLGSSPRRRRMAQADPSRSVIGAAAVPRRVDAVWHVHVGGPSGDPASSSASRCASDRHMTIWLPRTIELLGAKRKLRGRIERLSSAPRCLSPAAQARPGRRAISIAGRRSPRSCCRPSPTRRAQGRSPRAWRGIAAAMAARSAGITRGAPPPSGRRRPSSGCSGPCGASCNSFVALRGANSPIWLWRVPASAEARAATAYRAWRGDPAVVILCVRAPDRRLPGPARRHVGRDSGGSPAATLIVAPGAPQAVGGGRVGTDDEASVSITARTSDEVHEINVTPFIDVMRVLLIISWWRRRRHGAISVNLPTAYAPQQQRPPKPLFLTVSRTFRWRRRRSRSRAPRSSGARAGDQWG